MSNPRKSLKLNRTLSVLFIIFWGSFIGRSTRASNFLAKRAARKVLPAVVWVGSIRRVYTDGYLRKKRTYGTGMIVRPDGKVLTNYHVIRSGGNYECILENGRWFAAELVGANAETDTALLQLQARPGEKFPVVKIGSEAKLQKGQAILVIGNPAYLKHTVSVGTVSDPHRNFRRSRDALYAEYGRMYQWIQTDAIIEPGSSGSPVVDLHGRVVGMATRHTGDDLGLAIPGSILEEMVHRFLKYGQGRLSDFGLQFQTQASLGRRGSPGVVISNVRRGSGGGRAGLYPGDVLLALAGKELAAEDYSQIADLRKWLAFMAPGTSVMAEVNRGDETFTVPLTPEVTETPPRYFACSRWGFSVQELNHRYERFFDQSSPRMRIVAVAPDSPAEAAGLEPNDLLFKLGDRAIPDYAALKRVYLQFEETVPLEMPAEVLRGRPRFFTLLKVEKPDPTKIIPNDE